MPYCLYLRKSRADIDAEAHGETETLARHEKLLLDVAKRDKLHVTAIYREVVSGETIAARPVMQRLLQEVEQGLWDGVLVVEVERLARGDTIDQGIVAQTFKYSNTKIITPTKHYNPNNEFDEEYFEFGLFMSRREYKTINRRLQRGRLSSVKEGKYVGNKAPYGYQRVKIPHDKGYTLDPLPEEAEIVQLIYSLYTVGELRPDHTYKRLGVSLIARRLNAMHAPTRSGGDWVIATIRDILINPVYIGKIRWNWRRAEKSMVDGQLSVSRPRSSETLIYQGLHPAIISEDTFALAQEYMHHNPPRPIGERNTVKNPLAGLIICGKCGRRMVRRPYGQRRCEDTIMCAVTSCDNVSCNLSYVETRVLSGLADWLAKYRVAWQTDAPRDTAQIEQKRKAAKRLADELATLEQQFGNIHDLLEQGIYTPDMFVERSRLLTERIQKTRSSLDEIQAEIALDVQREQARCDIVPRVEHLLEVYHDLPDAKAKNDILKTVLDKAIYTKLHRARWHGSPDDFDLILYPLIPSSGTHSAGL